MIPGPMIVGFALVSGAWMLTIWRMVVEVRAQRWAAEVSSEEVI